MNRFLLGENEFDKFYDLYLYSFNRQDSSQRRRVFKERYDHSLSYGIMNGKDLGSGLFSIPFKVNFNNVEYKMNGIGDVMSAPEFGSQGGAGKLMNEALSDMYKNHVTLSYLAPFSFEYYRRFGFEQVFDHTQVAIKSENLPRIKNADHGHVERIMIKDIPNELKEMYLDHNSLGGVSRVEWWWDHMLDKHSDYRAALAYDDSDTLIGYLIYYNQDQKFYIHEWINTNSLSLQLLSKFVTKHQSIFSEFVYESPDPDFKSDILKNPYSLKLQVTPYMMARIVDLNDFLKRYPVRVNSLEKVYFKVTDTLEWNNHTWALSIKNGKVELNIADDEEAEIELTIQDFTKAMFGYRSLISLAALGIVKGDYGKIADLSSVFVIDKPQLIDYF